MNIITLPLGTLATNCYLASGENRNTVIIDPSCDAERISAELERNGLTPKMIFLTHGHFDHIMAAAELKEKYNLPVYVHTLDLPLLKDINRNLLSNFSTGEDFIPVENATAVGDGEKISADGLEFTVMHTPGHSAGSCCYISGDVIFSGDTLFAGSVGRTDFPGSSFVSMTDSLKKLNALGGDYKIFPGHGPATTLFAERRQNIYLAGMSDY